MILSTIGRYVARRFAFWFGAVLASLAAIIYLLDLVENARRAQRADASLAAFASLSLLKLPHLLMDAFPFVVLFAAMLCFGRLSRSQELTVIRAAGVSAWRFLGPVLLVVLAIGALRVAALNPLAATLYARYESVEAETLRGRAASSAAAQNGFWLRQGGADGAAIIHAQRVTSSRMELFDVVIWTFERGGGAREAGERFVSRIDARSARLADGAWMLADASISEPDRTPRWEASLRLPTDMTLAQIQDAFAAPETIPVWELPAFVRALENAGFSGHRHLLHLHRLLASPLLLVAMVLIAATVSFRFPRRGGILIMTLLGLGAGFVVFFAANLVSALGLSRAIPVHLAAWSPATIGTLIGAAILFHQEDG
jgi:lipopolysaccharide export system permease protein